MKEKHEISCVHSKLLQSIKQLSLDKRGAQPLRQWIDTVSKYISQFTFNSLPLTEHKL